MSIPQGWQCPKCNKIHAPQVLSCGCYQETYQYPKLTQEGTCLWDGMPETTPGSGMKIGMLSCPCPKCTARC